MKQVLHVLRFRYQYATVANAYYWLKDNPRLQNRTELQVAESKSMGAQILLKLYSILYCHTVLS